MGDYPTRDIATQASAGSSNTLPNWSRSFYGAQLWKTRKRPIESCAIDTLKMKDFRL